MWRWREKLLKGFSTYPLEFPRAKRSQWKQHRKKKYKLAKVMETPDNDKNIIAW